MPQTLERSRFAGLANRSNVPALDPPKPGSAVRMTIETRGRAAIRQLECARVRGVPFTSLVMISGLVLGIAQAGALEAPRAAALATLVKAYPDFLDRIDGNDLVWKDGTRQRIDDGKPAKTFEAMLDDPDIKDMFAMTYPAGDKGLAPAVNFDPGRIRYTPLFVKMYGDCQRSNLAADAATVVWLRSKYGKTVKFAKINGAAAALQKVSDELDRLPGRFLEYL
jgi:hypothetical protein